MNKPDRTAKKNTPPSITSRRLKLRGYKWKIDHLTPEELDWLQNGKPTDKPNIRGERPDYFYFYKQVENGECRIHKVGDWFLYNGVRIETMDKVAKCEELAKDGNKWAELQGKVEDTKPIAFEVPKIGELTYEYNKSHTTAIVKPAPGCIVLSGGPLGNAVVKYNNTLPFYLVQVNVGTEDQPNIVAVRYKRNKDNKDQYDYERTF